MYFNERSNLNRPKNKHTISDRQLVSKGPLTYQFRGSQVQSTLARRNPVSLGDSGGPDTGEVLNTANNRLQELMQLLYLLSRDPAVPSDARYHVTVAQSEIALLVRIMRNAEESAQPGATDHPQSGSLTTPTNL